MSRVGTTSVVFESVVRDGEEVLARARVVGVCVDNQTGRPARVANAFRDVIPG